MNASVVDVREWQRFDKGSEFAPDVALRKEMQGRNATGVVIGGSPAVRRVEEQVQQVAATDSTVLLLGGIGPQPHPSFIEV